MIFNLIYLIVGVGIGYVLTEYVIDKKTKSVRMFLKCIKKKIPIAFLETDKATYFRPIEKIYKSLGIYREGNSKQVVIFPKSSLKPCLNLGGVPIVHGDLYKSAAVPTEVVRFINERLNAGWKDEDIAQFFQEIESIPSNKLKEIYKNLKDMFALSKSKNKKDLQEIKQKIIGKGEEIQPVSKIDAEKYDVYMGMSSVVKDFIYTGLNRVSIHDMLRELVYQRELERLGKKNWILIAITIFIILIAVAMFLRFIFSTPALSHFILGSGTAKTTTTTTSVLTTIPSRVAPGG
ncbi:hypothetical protein DRQ26_00705 [bacterium]|nr:MAG: hypothetical protein DRQ26_00705 [bacterium]